MYMYQMLSKAIFDSEDKNKIKSDWSPNTIKNIVILRDCIIVVYHTTRQTKFVQLNQEALDDIMSNGSKGALHNVLGAYQLSCLEEIYVDSVFQNYLGTFNLDKYVNGLKNTRSRLRYCGYVQWVMGAGQNIFNYYNSGKQALSEDYTLAQSKGVVNIGIQSLDNTDWYTKHNLRPENYKLDKEKGTLDAWFTKVERDMTEYYGQVKKEVYANAVDKLYCALFEKLLGDLKYYRYWFTMVKLIKSGKKNSVGGAILKWVNFSNERGEKIFKPNVYITKDKAVELYNNYFKKKRVSSEDFTYALWLLKTVGVLNDEKASGNYTEELVEKMSDKIKPLRVVEFINYKWIGEYIDRLLKVNKTDSLHVQLICEKHGIVQKDVGELRQVLEKNLNENNDFKTAIVILHESCGFSSHYLDEVIQREDTKGGK